MTPAVPTPESRTSARRRSTARSVLMTTAAMACVGVAAIVPVAGALAAETRVAAVQGPIEVRVAVNSGFARVDFLGPLGQQAQVTQSGNTVVVKLPKGAHPNLARLRVDPPKGVAGVDTRPASGGLEIVITLEPGASIKTGRADGSVYLNLFPPRGDIASAAPSETTRASPVPASGVVKVSAAVDAQVVELRFPWAAPVASAVFRRGDAVYVVFDAKAKLDLGAQAKGSLGPVRRMRWMNGADFTVLRIEAPEAVSLAAASDGATWTITLGAQIKPPENAIKIDRDDQTGPPALTAALTGATKVIWLTDPVIGDRFAAVTALGDPRPVDRKRTLIETTLLPTVHGVAVEATAPDVSVSIVGDLVRIERPKGLTLSPPTAIARAASTPIELPQAAIMPGLIDFEHWSRTGEAGFLPRYRQLQDLAMTEGAKGKAAPVSSRMAFARFLVGSELNYEAIGVLDMLAKQNPAMLNDPELRGMRGAARAMAGRYKEAQADFSASVAASDPSCALWRGYIDAKLGNWTEARKAFTGGARAIDLFSPKWKARFAVAHATAALELKDSAAAQSLLAFALAQSLEPTEQLAALLVQARVFETGGQTDRALAVYEAISQASMPSLSTPAMMHATRIKYDKGLIKPSEAVAQLDSLRFRWRGDGTELEVIRTLGEIYLGQGHYREALQALRSAGGRLNDSPAALQLQAELSDAFRKLFLQGGADNMEPIQAVALFLDFRELTPPGGDGDEMLRRLSRRLVDVDLLPQAAELLKYQVENRLDGVAKAQVATNLAAIYLMDRKPELALETIWGSRTTLLPNALNAQRRVLEARALTELTKYDNALELLGKDTSPEALDVRAEVYWRQKDWANAAAVYERRLGERFKNSGTALSGEEETRLIRTGVAYSMAGDAKGLARVADRYAPFVPQSRAPEALRIALVGLDGSQVSPSDFARITSQADTFAGWVAGMKDRFRGGAAQAVKAAVGAAG
jgi:tetratricopeptide (TPR) repeat protein